MKEVVNLVRRGGGSGGPDQPEMRSIIAFNAGSSLHEDLEAARGSKLRGRGFLLLPKHEIPATGLAQNLVFVGAPSLQILPPEAVAAAAAPPGGKKGACCQTGVRCKKGVRCALGWGTAPRGGGCGGLGGGQRWRQRPWWLQQWRLCR